MWNTVKTLGLATGLLLWALAAEAELLTVTRGDASVTLSQEEFDAMPQVEFTTVNDYVSEPTAFRGVLLREVLDLVQAQPGDNFRAVAFNDYAITLPYDDATAYDVIIARYRNGAPMPLRNKGPLWVIYPMEDMTEADRFSVNSKLIWQLKTLEHVVDAQD